MRGDPQRLTRLAKPVLIDEWQHYPPVWDRVRHDVDAGATPGSYLLAALRRAPKHHLADPALAARLLGVGSRSLLSTPNPGTVSIARDETLLGALFESLVTQSVRVYADSARPCDSLAHPAR